MFLSLAIPTIRAINWVPLAGAIVALSLVGASVYGFIDGLRPSDALTLQRGSALVLGATAPFCLVDRMAPSVSALPVPRWVRQWLRLTLSVLIVAVVWGTLLLWGRIRLGSSAVLPASGLGVEALAIVLVGFLGTALALRTNSAFQAGIAGIASELFLIGATAFLRGGWHPWPVPGSEYWNQVHIGWLAMACALLFALVFLNRDIR
ncbi:hypothetical protein [Spongiactinospora sp. 9N601]|uniref:hypothetical protein n=1 Tax=Spongiactinospora sp. 9N601 TaxID=3375149 RepID=UPI00379217B1